MLLRPFADSGAVQCGFCSPGFIMSTQYLLSNNATPTREEVRDAVAGNLCRCTGYKKIVDAGIAASNELNDVSAKTLSKTEASCIDENFVRPENLDKALDLLAQAKNYKVLSGSTDISVQFEHHLKDHSYLDISAIDELNFIREESDTVVIGATTPYTDIINSAITQKWARILVDASREVGAVQIQNLGTLGGNIVNASPSADGVPALIALGASAVIRSAKKERTVLAEEIAIAPSKSIVNSDELITEIIIPKRLNEDAIEVSFFEKLGPRKTQTIAIVSVSFCAGLENGRLSDVKIGFRLQVAPTIVRAPKTEEFLMDGSLTEERVLAAADRLVDECSPIDDVRATATYRKKLVRGLLIRGLWPYLNS